MCGQGAGGGGIGGQGVVGGGEGGVGGQGELGGGGGLGGVGRPGERRDRRCDSSSALGSLQLVVLGATAADERLPSSREMPADSFTSCLTRPIEMALKLVRGWVGGLGG